VEGTGDHGCEYMTGGRVVVIGKTGRNFGAGMSGGIAYVLNETGDFADKCNTDMTEICAPDADDEKLIYEMLSSHVKYTQSSRAKEVLEYFNQNVKRFVKVLPLEYKAVLEQRNKSKLIETKEG
jgi:glutamate synthase (ferredoxin)